MLPPTDLEYPNAKTMKPQKNDQLWHAVRKHTVPKVHGLESFSSPKILSVKRSTSWSSSRYFQCSRSWIVNFCRVSYNHLVPRKYGWHELRHDSRSLNNPPFPDLSLSPCDTWDGRPRLGCWTDPALKSSRSSGWGNEREGRRTESVKCMNSVPICSRRLPDWRMAASQLTGTVGPGPLGAHGTLPTPEQVEAEQEAESVSMSSLTYCSKCRVVHRNQRSMNYFRSTPFSPRLDEAHSALEEYLTLKITPSLAHKPLYGKERQLFFTSSNSPTHH